MAPKLDDLHSSWKKRLHPSLYWIPYSWSGSTIILYYINLSVSWNTLLRNQISLCQHVFYYRYIISLAWSFSVRSNFTDIVREIVNTVSLNILDMFVRVLATCKLQQLNPKKFLKTCPWTSSDKSHLERPSPWVSSWKR